MLVVPFETCETPVGGYSNINVIGSEEKKFSGLLKGLHL